MPKLKSGRFARALAMSKARRSARQATIKAKRAVKKNRTNVRLGLGFPKKLTVTHKYNEQVALNTGVTGATTNYLWSCNGLFDPNISGGGHQPMFFDQMVALYNHYTVIGSKIKIRVAKSDANTNIPVTVGVLINDDTSSNTNINTLCETTSCKYRVLSTGNPVTTFTNKWSAKKVFGGSILGNDQLQGTSGANPTEQSYYQFFCNSDVNATQTSVMLDVEITYIAVWDELKDIAGS